MQGEGNRTQSMRRKVGSRLKAACLVHLILTFGLVLLVAPGFCNFASAQPPGPELFAKEPRTPLELWDAVDYLLRTNQAKKALPYLDRFMKSRPDDATLVAIRDRYGPASILQLSDDPLTGSYAKPLTEAMVIAARRYATRPDRIARFIDELTKTTEEQDYAIRHLREAGAEAVPFLIEALSRPDLSAQDHRLLVANIGQLDRSAVPPLVAALDSPNPILAADAATALGLIGDVQAVPHLTFLAASPTTPVSIRTASQVAIAQLTRRPFAAQPHQPVQVLTDAAWSYHRHKVEFPGDPVVIWAWDRSRKVPVSREVPRTEVEAIFGLRFAKEALALNPNERVAQIAELSLTLEKAIERVGFTSFLAKDEATFTAAIAKGPSILSDALKSAIADRKTDLAAACATALGRAINRTALAGSGQPHPLVEALYSPGRRVQFAAAKAIMELAPNEPFPGSSRVVPTLARFLTNQALSRAVVIDGNPNRGSQMAGFLINLGYDSELELTGNQGFLAAAESADVELILISYDLFQKGWGLNDTLANLGADSRTAAIPVFIYGPLNVKFKRPNLEYDYPGIRFLVQPVDAAMLDRQLKTLPAVLAEQERTDYSREAATLLAKIAKDSKGPLAAHLTDAEPALAGALGVVETAPIAAAALGDLPDPDAQRSLAALVLDPSRDPNLRRQTAAQLIHSIHRYGRLITADQEARLAATIREEYQPEVLADLITIFRTLRPIPTPGLARIPRPSTPAETPAPVQTPPASSRIPPGSGAD
jgi:HEAT repeats